MAATDAVVAPIVESLTPLFDQLRVAALTAIAAIARDIKGNLEKERHAED